MLGTADTSGIRDYVAILELLELILGSLHRGEVTDN